MNYLELSDILTKSLDLEQPAVAVRFAEELQEEIPRFRGTVAAGCQFWEEGMDSTFGTVSADHGLCAIGVHTHNLEPTDAQQVDLGAALKVFGELGYVRQEDIPQIPVLGTRPKHVMYGPLAEATATPDVVLLFVDANRMLVLSEAAQQVDGPSLPAMGRPACAVIPQVANSGRAAISLGCCGARAYLDVLTPDMAIFAIPGSKLDAYSKRIEALANANSVLTKFHQIRRRDVEEGGRPTVEESLRAM